MTFLFEVCENSNFLEIVQVIMKVVNVITWIIPIILIVMVSLDIAKNVIKNSEEEMKKNVQLPIKRIIWAIALPLIPVIVRFAIILLGELGVPYVDCLTNATEEKINELKQLEEQQQESQKTSNSTTETTTNNTTNTTNNTQTPSNTETKTEEKGLDTGANFTKINKCSTGKVIVNSNGVKLRKCITNYKSDSFQNFAITDNYVYFTYLAKEKQGTKIINRNRIVRVNRTNSQYQAMYINYAGHGQCFDVANKYATDDSGKIVDKIFLNYFTNYDKSKTPKHFNNGITYCNFTGKAKKSGSEKIPEVAIAIQNKGSSGDAFHIAKSLKVIKKKNYYKSNGTFDSETYYNLVQKIGLNTNSYLTNAQIAVDETFNQILLYTTNKMSYIYKLSDFLNGKLTLIKKFKMDLYYGQGVEIYGNYVYHYRGNKNENIEFRKYNINTGKLVKYVLFDYLTYSKKNNITMFESEGITIYKGNIYVGVYYKKSGTTYADIYYVEGI